SQAQNGSPILSLTAVNPRAFGYFVGDVIDREIVADVAEPYRLDIASLPAPGRLTYWLELRSLSLDEGELANATRYRLTLRYQTFYVPLQPSRLTIPSFTLKFEGGGKSAETQVAPWDFVMSPLREIEVKLPEEGPSGYLLPDAKPQVGSARAARMGFAAALAFAATASLALAYYYSCGPFRKRPARPFTQAARAIKRRLAVRMSEDSYRQSLLDLHRAFDLAAGKRLFAGDVPDFLATHSEFAPMARDIARFFATSREAFFADKTNLASAAMSPAAVAELSARLGEAERRAA
ncbi:MAG TPA: nonribosomal peptide synthetase MxaA, partial [Methylomirabilota bacterium]|nr:nonribosomal peptide synthetase MxaA [Methylomirabilota bacterium]